MTSFDRKDKRKKGSGLAEKIRAPFSAAWQMIRGKGITRRWLLNTFAVSTVVLMSIVVALSFFLRNYYYTSLEQGLAQRSSVTISYFSDTVGSGINSGNSIEFFNAAQSFVENFDQRGKMELQFLNSNGEIIVSSTGFPADTDEPLTDYNKAVQSSRGLGSWSGTNSNGESVLAVCRLISRSAGSSAGAVRFVVSLEETNQLVAALSLALFITTLIILFFMLISGSYFVASIVVPVKAIGNSASEIAKGNFDIRLDSSQKDELGDLADSINAMAGELADSERVKNDFISTVSHELRTPLTAIRGWGETLRDCGADDRELMEKGMGVIISETERLSGLVEDLLDFSRIQSGRMSMSFERLDVIAEVTGAVCLFYEQCAQQNKSLQLDVPDGICPVIGDRARIKQVFVNIIENAIKYTDDGGEINVSVVRDPGGVTVRIRDNGCGIAPDDINRVSRRFYKANMSRGGFGIGLAVAEEIVELHQGSLTIESTESVGTQVTITLPSAARFDHSAASAQ